MKRACLRALGCSSLLAACLRRDAASSGLGAPHVAPGALVSPSVLAEAQRLAIDSGAGALSVVASGELAAGERLGGFVEVPVDRCLLVYARASRTVQDVDVALFSDEGEVIALDEGPDAKPGVVVCPPHPARVYAAVHAATGRGLASLGAHLVAPEVAARVASAVHARLARGGAPSEEAWPALGALVANRRRAAGGTWQEVRRLAVAVDERAATVVAVPVAAQSCADVLSLLGDGVGPVDAELKDERGQSIARAANLARSPSFGVCSDAPIDATLELRPHSGSGVVALVVGSVPLARAEDLGHVVPLAWIPSRTTIAEARRILEGELAIAGHARASAAFERELAVGRRATVALPPANSCVRVDVLAGAPASLVEGGIWSAQGQLVTEARGSSRITLSSCEREASSLEVELRGQAGPIAAIVRPAADSASELFAHPLAGARLLQASTSARGERLVERSVSTLASDRRDVWTFAVPRGACAAAFAGTEGAGSGIVLRAFDGSTGDELDRAEGQRAASVRACASSTAPRAVRFEARASTGTVEVARGVRVTSPEVESVAPKRPR